MCFDRDDDLGILRSSLCLAISLCRCRLSIPSFEGAFYALDLSGRMHKAAPFSIAPLPHMLIPTRTHCSNHQNFFKKAFLPSNLRRLNPVILGSNHLYPVKLLLTYRA